MGGKTDVAKARIKECFFRLPVITVGIVMATCLAFLTPTTSSRVHAQGVVFYYQDGGYHQPYGQGFSTGYGQGYYGSYGRTACGGYGQGYAVRGPYYSTFPSQSGMFGNASYGYSFPGSVPSADGRSTYYRPAYGRVYGPQGAYWLY